MGFDDVENFLVAVLSDYSSLKDNTAEDHGRKELQAAVTNFKKAFDLVRAESNEQRVVDTLVESILESLAAAYMKLRFVE